jgi:GT2 family glycosyltransferase
LLLVNLFKYFFRKLDKRPLSLQNPVNASRDHNLDENLNSTEGKVSIIIPTRDKASLLRSCIDSIIEKTDYKNFEIIVVDNGSREPETMELLETLQQKGIQVIDYPKKFNFSAICNFAASVAKGEYLCFLNNDTEVIRSDWLGSMVEHAKISDVGLVGAILTYPDSTFQHVGIALEHGGVASHPYRGLARESFLSENCFQVSGVTFACAVISKHKYDLLGGLDPKFPAGFNDVDFSIRCLEEGLRNIVCVRANLLHSESKSRPRTQSLGGFAQAVADVLSLIWKHPKPPRELFFSR